ncbi:hypothetical protein [Candidatus Lucifugimonas marina]|uniref:Uncharacterized protein n=1 Tax=Candidatus Lucifugimonas marina TaxID=3038979 RepID=A0AAJ5ZG05_9CHLR|nr:hypothetical protein [SAR202 cluster bacterium JH702]MDG0869398.1 hypothetical protein [SAR202 cluster bacterium JH639]WFG34144.1 hypothetical protein GKN94_00065 [SAR202 cluster bacterium JH545]WFG38071.1 hypothetical protein GKO48_00065 [SAR202 cluster bacterium JH1073]
MPFFRGSLRRNFITPVRFQLAFLSLLAFGLIVGCSSDTRPDPTSTPIPTQEPIPTAAVKPVELTVDELLSSIERSMEELRGIEKPPPVDHRFVDQAGMREKLAEQLEDPETLEQIDHEEVLFKLLGVIPQDADLNAIYDSMFGSQVLGLYDPEKEEFFVLGDDSSGAESIDTEAQLTYAHEYVHRLQDAKFDLEVLKDLADNDDMSLAISAIIEGDATSAQSQYMLANYDFLELSELLETTLARQEELPDIPHFLEQSLQFAYSDGVAFMSVILQLGEFAAVDAVFAKPPSSTEQILHPEKYLDKEEPIELDIPDDGIQLSGWNIQAENVMGEFFLRTWLEAIGSVDAVEAAAGWGGDVYTVVESQETGEPGLVMTTAWDTAEDAKEFFTVLSEAMESNPKYVPAGRGIPGVLESWWGPGGYLVMSRWSSEGVDRVVIGHGSSVEIAQQLEMAGAYEFSDETEITVLD